ncbi:uncharacterized protein [Aegilops tauschii subsp. strangulata]|uniref:uncharacterized protein n=1 Tax=Aegilops tauschii subsp. strangulata TaxID=200361 RepID=UPI003CC8803E
MPDSLAYFSRPSDFDRRTGLAPTLIPYLYKQSNPRPTPSFSSPRCQTSSTSGSSPPSPAQPLLSSFSATTRFTPDSRSIHPNRWIEIQRPRGAPIAPAATASSIQSGSGEEHPSRSSSPHRPVAASLCSKPGHDHASSSSNPRRPSARGEELLQQPSSTAAVVLRAQQLQPLRRLTELAPRAKFRLLAAPPPGAFFAGGLRLVRGPSTAWSRDSRRTSSLSEAPASQSSSSSRSSRPSSIATRCPSPEQHQQDPAAHQQDPAVSSALSLSRPQAAPSPGWPRRATSPFPSFLWLLPSPLTSRPSLCFPRRSTTPWLRPTEAWSSKSASPPPLRSGRERDPGDLLRPDPGPPPSARPFSFSYLLPPSPLLL